MKHFLTVCALLLLGVWFTPEALAQSTVSGQVLSADDGSPLIGVSVVIKGTSTGTTTDVEGKFSLSAKSDAILVFSFVGMQTMEVPVGNQSQFEIKLKNDEKLLSEVVVVGYGEQSRRTMTSSISSVAGLAISNLATPSFDQQLAGRAAGVQVTIGSGLIGQTPNIRIRGTNSITSGTQPLVVVNGVPITTGNQSSIASVNPLADINPSDIESFEVLKDGAATAIYGSRAANGVILITTKGGKKNSAVKINFDTYVGFAQVSKKFDLLNADQFIQISNEKFKNGGVADQAFAGPNNENTDWQSAIFRTGVVQNYVLGVSGGTDKTSYYFSGGYQDQKGAMVANSQQRFTFRSTLDHQINKWMDVGMNFSIARTTTDGLNSGTNALSGNITGAARMFPNVPIYDANNPTGYNLSSDNAVLGSGNNKQNITNNYTNIKFVLDNNVYRSTSSRLIGNGYIGLNLADGLRFKSQVGADYTNLAEIQALDPRHGDGRGANGTLFQNARNILMWNVHNVLSYNKTFDDHSISLTVGNEFQLTSTSRFNGGGSNFSDRYFLQNGLITGTYATQTSSGTYYQQGFDSYFARANYGYKNRYLLGISFRNDGISDIPLGNRRGNFYGGSIGYRVSEEDFYKNSAIAKVMNEFKVRASYAQVGNINIGVFPAVSTYGGAQYASQNGIAFTQAGNSDLKWETSKKLDVGVEMGFLDNKITAEVDYFRNDIDGLILDAPTPSSLGIPNNTISKNIGSMVNQGVELTLNAEVMNKNGFKWNVNFNYTMVKNEVKSLVKNTNGVDQDILPTSTAFQGNFHVIRVGQAVPTIYGYQYAGVNPSNGNPLFMKGTGKVVQRSVDTGGYSFYDAANPSNTTNTAGAALNPLDISQGGDRQTLGVTVPTWFGGFSNNFSYKGFDLEIFLRYSGGNYIMNATRQETLANQEFNNNGTEILNRWQKEGDQTDVPKVRIGRTSITNLTGVANSRFVEKGDFLRIQNISLGYTMPQSLLSNIKTFPIRSLRVYASVQNAYTFTAYKGLDPELNASTGSQVSGVDFNSNPQQRLYTFGLNLGF
jgi:TonB-dependent starch-binding outer membrane protein SusC